MAATIRAIGWSAWVDADQRALRQTNGCMDESRRAHKGESAWGVAQTFGQASYRLGRALVGPRGSSWASLVWAVSLDTWQNVVQGLIRQSGGGYQRQFHVGLHRCVLRATPGGGYGEDGLCGQVADYHADQQGRAQ